MELTPSQFSDVRESLTTAEKTDRAAEKRKFTRLPVHGKVTLTHHPSGHSHTALTRDLSINGMGIVQSRPATPGDHYLATLPRAENHPLQAPSTLVAAPPLAERLYRGHLQFQRLPNDPDAVTSPGSESPAPPRRP